MASLSFDFLAGMAHELRTPLGGIGGYAELLELGVHGPVTPAQADGLQRVRKNQRAMVQLINGVMAYAEVAAGARQLAPALFSLSDALQASLAAMTSTPTHRATHIGLETDVANVTYFGDEAAFADVIRELLLDGLESGNTEATSRVVLAVTSEHVTITITSDAEPIPATARECVFVPYDRGSRGSRQSAALHALSLPYARALARLMGGDVVAVSERDVRTLSYTLPRVAPV